MALQSMTGFARGEGAVGSFRWAWELRSVNGRGLDLRVRVPTGYDKIEPIARKAASKAFQRGNIQISLTVSRDESQARPTVNEESLNAVVAAAEELAKRIGSGPPTVDGLLNIRGVLEFNEPAMDPETARIEEAALFDGLKTAVADLAAMRSSEGEKIGALLLDHVVGIEALIERVESDPSRTPAAIVKRLEQQVRMLLDANADFDADRLHMEAAILAAKADLREEIDRLTVHAAACRDLLRDGGPIGRRLDFLAQEFNRETNTICSKSNAASVTSAGLELKVLIDQFREQVQNLE
ncbi:MAG: YicC family protein [Alphaproteobacteria bacterium]|nr:YicC family protein [Alphaproteobacteria bacterium]